MPKRSNEQPPRHRDHTTLTASAERERFAVLSRVIHRTLTELTRRLNDGTASAYERQEYRVLTDIARDWIAERP